MLFFSPYLLELDMDIILLGPGVKVVIKTYDKNAVRFGIKNTPSVGLKN